MNKLDFMQMGRKSIQTYLYEKYGITVEIRDIELKSYSDISDKQKGRYTLGPWAFPRTKSETILRAEFLVIYDPTNHSYFVDERRTYDSKRYQPAYILATSDSVNHTIQHN